MAGTTTIIKNDLGGAVSASQLIKGAVVLLVVAIGLSLLAGPVRSLFNSLKPIPADGCPDDSDYFYKDPFQHPNCS
jgi:hypothetical protein